MLINCAAYHQGVKLADLAPEDIGDYIDRLDTFVWLALRDADAAELETYRRQFNLHTLAVEEAGHGSLAVFVRRNYVLSVRNGSKLHFLGVRERCESEPELLRQGPSFVLYALMDAVVDRYFPILDLLESELDEIEQRIFTNGAARDNIQRLYLLKQRLMLLRRAVLPMLEMLSKLHGGRIPPVCARSNKYFRDVADHLARIHGAIESVRETIGTAIQANFSMVAIEDSDVTKRLAAWAGIFAAATAFAGIWGMNFELMPELKWRWGYPAAIGLITTVCIGLWWRFKKAVWL